MTLLKKCKLLYRNTIFISYLSESQIHSIAPKYSKLQLSGSIFLKVVIAATTELSYKCQQRAMCFKTLRLIPTITLGGRYSLPPRR